VSSSSTNAPERSSDHPLVGRITNTDAVPFRSSHQPTTSTTTRNDSEPTSRTRPKLKPCRAPCSIASASRIGCIGE